MGEEMRKRNAEARHKLGIAREDSRFGHVPLTDEEKYELENKLLNVEQLRLVAEAAAVDAFRAEEEFKARFVELAAKHGVKVGEEVLLPSKGTGGVRMVSGPSELTVSVAGGRPCEKLHSCIACDTVCCWAWECSNCEGCHECTIGT